MESSRLGRRIVAANARVSIGSIMSSLKVMFGVLAAGFMLSGCMQATTYQAAPEATLKPSDKAQLAKARYAAVPPGGTVPPRHRRLSPQGTARHHRGRFRQPLSVPGAGQRQGDPLRRDRRRGRPRILRYRPRRQHGGMAEMDADRRHSQAHRRPACLGARRRRQSARRPRALSLSGQHATPCSAFTAPTSRNISAHRFRRAASA